MHKLIYRFVLTNKSTLSIGAAYSSNTDHDIIRYSDNTPFIPASSIAGSFFSKSKYSKNVFGIVTDAKEIKDESRLFISDGIFTADVKESTRDGIQLDSNKRTVKGAKYDTEVILDNQEWSFFIEYDVNNNLIDVQEAIIDVANNIQSGLFRLGYKQNRGYGIQKITHLYFKEIKDYHDYMNFCGEELNQNDLINQINSNLITDGDILLSLKVKLISPLIVREYSEILDYDYSQLMGNNNRALVPGTSINGVLQHRIIDVYAPKLKNIDLDSLKDEIKKTVVDELYLDGKNEIITRNKIDHFSGAVIDGALITEKVFVPTENSIGTLSVRIRGGNKVIAALYYLALRDIGAGLVNLGGEASIGRGIFENIGDISLIGVEINELISSLKEA